MSSGIIRTAREGSSRGQLLLVVALLLAVVFVVLAVVVNGAIYTENLGTRDSGDPSTAHVEQGSIDDGVLESVNEANGNVESTSYTDLQDAFEGSLASYNRTLEAEYGKTGRLVSVEKTDDVRGVRVRQTNESRNMTSKHGDWNWNLTDEVDEGGHFTMNLQEGSLYEMTLDTTLSAMADSAFGVEFHLDSYGGSGDGVWRVYFFEGAATDNIYAIVEQPDQTFQDNTVDAVDDGYLDQACSLQGDSVSIRLSQSTYGGLYCEEFDFYGPDNISTHAIRFVNARSDADPSGLLGSETESDRARGAYDIMLGTTTFNSSAMHGVGNGQPWHQAAIYRANYSITYRSSETTYTVDDRAVWPTRSDPGGVLRQHPTLETFDVTDATADEGDPAFDVEWTVTDVDRDLDRVELHLIHVDTETVADEIHVSVSNGSATGTDRLVDASLVGAVGEDYRVQITAVDTSGRATTDSEVHQAGS